ncbi:hypothetical protein AX16_008661 [Volvariella volvacea WC 439]|nr:hypothetical protein AX16_008661 [Volvariella volvacea WC 439]
MADVHTGKLCAQIIHDHFGPLTGRVASVLLSRGRLPLSQVVRYTGLKPRTVRAAIIVLVQHNLLWHAQTDDSEEGLEINTEECMTRLRFGRYVFQTEKLFGTHAAEIVQLILDHGKLRAPEVLSRLAYDPKTTTLYRQALQKLVTTTHLKPSTTLSHISPCDKILRYEAEEKAKISGFPSAKELREVKEIARARIRREEEEAEKVGLKRKGKEPVAKHRQRKVIDEDIVVDDDVYFRVNFEKYNVHIRNALIETACKERYGEGAAIVMRATLKVTEASQLKVSDSRSDSVSVASIVMQLSGTDKDLTSGLIFSSKRVSNATAIKDYLGMLACADNPTPAGKASAFISFSSSKIQVEFETVGRRLRRRMLESVTREKYGTEGIRILRLLLSVGKLDEKQISKVVMMAAKDVRPLLTSMTADCLISTQEVAKSADRNPTRTIYLWYVDLHKAYSVILGNLYKTLYNIGTRRQGEKEVPEVKAVLEKRERTDVQQDESLLTRLERDILTEWQRRQQKLTVLASRVEEAVFVMRDLAVYGVDDD